MKKITFFTLSLIALMFTPEALALDVSVRAINARPSDEYSPKTAWELGYTGKGVNIAVIDTGVDEEHADLNGKSVAGVDFTIPETFLTPRNGEFNPDDNAGHGTLCAGIGLGSGKKDEQYKGVAPDSKLLDLKTNTDGRQLGSQTQTVQQHTEAILEAFDWVINNKDTFEIDVISISESCGGFSDGSDPLGQKANQVVESGVVMVTAAGNQHSDGYDGFRSFRAADHTITVGAIDDKNTILREDDAIADFSNWGPRLNDNDDNPYDEMKPDVVAPGRNIIGPCNSERRIETTGYRESGGTSFACPHVAGVVALMLEANQELNPFHVKEILHITAEPRGEPSYPDLNRKYNLGYGYGLLDAYAAVKLALETDATSTDPFKIVFISSLRDGIEINGSVRVEGRAFAKQGDIDDIEVRVDNGSWKKVNVENQGKWYNWFFMLDTAKYKNGNHSISVRTTTDDMHSFEDKIYFTTSNPDNGRGIRKNLPSSKTMGVMLIIIVAGTVGIYEYKTKKLSNILKRQKAKGENKKEENGNSARTPLDYGKKLEKRAG